MKKFIPVALAALVLSTAPAARAGTEWMCLAQDHEYSYEGNSANKAEAQREALRACRAGSAAPANCYSHRCEASHYQDYYNRGPIYRGGPIVVPGPRPAPGDNDPIVTPGGMCNSDSCLCTNGSVAPGGTSCP